MDTKESTEIVVTHDEQSSASSSCEPPFQPRMALPHTDLTARLPPHSTRLLSVDEVISLVSNAKKDKAESSMDDSSCRMHRIASADGDLSTVVDEFSDITSDGTLSRCTSTDRISLADGQVEDRFRVDRRKLEAMILGCPPDPCDFEIMRLPIGSDGRILSADDFFARVMASTNTEIRYPRLLKVGARNRKDPHVRVVGTPDNVNFANQMVRAQLEPHNKITMKMDVSWTHHSHIIGKAGNTIQPVVRRTGVSIHFPDGNKNNEIRKSNQVSINSRGEELVGLEEARASIRNLTPLIFTFTLSADAKYISITDPNMLVQHVQGLFNVQVELSVTSGTSPLLLGSVRGSETDVSRVKEATYSLLKSLCGSVAGHLTVHMKIEVSPQHHSFILGRNNELLKKIMTSTSTTITFPDNSNANLAPLERSTVVISGAIDNVYAARQNIVGALPLVLMFEVAGGSGEGSGNSSEDIIQMMQSFNIAIICKPVRADGRQPVIIKGHERDADLIYQAWQSVTRSDKKIPKARIPPSYHIAMQSAVTSSSSLSLGHSVWGGGRVSGVSSLSPLPSPLTPAFPPPTPVFPPSNYPQPPPMLPSPVWPMGGGGSAPPQHTPSHTGTSFPFPAPSNMLYDAANAAAAGGNSRNYFTTSSLANIAGLSNLPTNNSPTFPNIPSNSPLFPNSNNSMLPNNMYGNNSNYLGMGTTNSYLGGGGNMLNTPSLFSMSNTNTRTNNYINAPDNNTQQELQQQQQQHQQRQQQLEALKSLYRGPSQDDIQSCGGSSSGVSSPSITSPNHESSPRDSSPDVVLGHIQSPPIPSRPRTLPQQVSPALQSDMGGPYISLSPVQGQDGNTVLRDLSSLLSEFDRRAPGYEKELQVAMQKLSISDYEAKQILASKAMREPVGGTVRVPTSNWSGYGFSKSSPSANQMRQQFQEVGLLKKTTVNTRAADGGATTAHWNNLGRQDAAHHAEEGAPGGRGWSSHLQQQSTATEEDWPSSSKWSSHDGCSPGGGSSAAGRSGGVDSGLAASITSSNQASLSLSDPESSDGLGNSGSSSACSYGSAGGGTTTTRGGGGGGGMLPRLSASSISECVGSSTMRLITPTMASVASMDLPQLLANLNLSQYIDTFQRHEVDTSTFLGLNDSDLKQVGISLFGHRKKLLIAIKNLTNSLPEFCKSSNNSDEIGRLEETKMTSDKTVTWNC